MDQILQEILCIKSNNTFLQYIVDRVQRDDYRGIQISQHNRYDLDTVVVMLKKIYEGCW